MTNFVCPQCAAPIQPGTRTCPTCRTTVEVCAQCGSGRLTDDRFCPTCGAEKVPVVSVPPELETPADHSPPPHPSLSARPAARRRPVALALAALGGLAVIVLALFVTPGDEEAAEPADRLAAAAAAETTLSPGDDIAAALTRLAPDGVVRLSPGRYPLAAGLTPLRPVRFIGRGPDSTVIELSGAGGIEFGTAAVGSELIGAAIVVRTGLPAGLVIRGSVGLEDLRIEGTGVRGDDCGEVGAGILIGGESRPTVRRVTVTGFCVGVRVADSAGPSLVGVSLLRNRTGIQYLGASSGELQGSHVEGNVDGVVVLGGQPAIDQNVIERNSGFGLTAIGRPGPIVGKNQVRRNGINLELP